MRQLSALMEESWDENMIAEEQHIPLGDTGLVGTFVNNVIIIENDKHEVVAAVQNGMLHEAIVLFQAGLEDLLALDGITLDEPYKLDDISHLFSGGREDQAPMPAEAAVWLKRMPGHFYTSSPLMLTPERVHPRATDDLDYSSFAGDEAYHVLSQLEYEARREAEATWHPQRWSLVSETRWDK